jgi:hypothetical protein
MTNDKNRRIRIQDPDQDPRLDPLVRGMDPQIRIRIHPKMSWIRNTDSQYAQHSQKNFCTLSVRDKTAAKHAECVQKLRLGLYSLLPSMLKIFKHTFLAR